MKLKNKVILLSEKEIFNYLKKIELIERKNLLVSGGSTIPKLLNSKYFKFKKKFLLTDERLIGEKKYLNFHKFKNKKLIFFNYFREYEKNNFTKVKKKIAKLLKKNFYCLIGAGNDGHFSSLFSEKDCSKKEILILTKNYKEKFRRISVNFSTFLNLRIVVILPLKDKLPIIKKIFQNNPHDKTPINMLLKKNKKAKIIITI